MTLTPMPDHILFKITDTGRIENLGNIEIINKRDSSFIKGVVVASNDPSIKKGVNIIVRKYAGYRIGELGTDEFDIVVVKRTEVEGILVEGEL